MLPDEANAVPVHSDDLTVAARAIGDALAVTGPASISPTWPAALAAVRARFRGSVAGVLVLGADEAGAAQLVAEPTAAVTALGAALVALGIATDEVDVDPFEPADTPSGDAVVVDGGDGTSLAVQLLLDRSDEHVAATAGTGPADPAAFEPSTLDSPRPGPAAAVAGTLGLLNDVDMEVTVELGRTTLPIRELLSLQPGMVVEIDRVAGAPIDVLVNGRLIAHGEIVVVDEEFGVRITDIAATEAMAR